jgi:hypothetical protein
MCTDISGCPNPNYPASIFRSKRRLAAAAAAGAAAAPLAEDTLLERTTCGNDLCDD